MEEFLGFAELSEDEVNFSGEKLVLTADVTVNLNAPTTSKDADETKTAWTSYLAQHTPTNWKPIGVRKAFAGEFDGQGHTIQGIYSSTTVSNTGLFGFADKQSYIHDFALVDSYFASNKDTIGGVVGFARGDVTNIYCNSYVTGPNNVGGLIGSVDFTSSSNKEECVISNCWFDGAVRATGIHVGGMMGSVNYNGTKASLEHCLNTGYISSSDTQHGRVGGLCGNINHASAILNIVDSLNVGKVVCSKNTGAVVGRNAGKLYVGTKSTYYANDIEGSVATDIASGSATSGTIEAISQTQLYSSNAEQVGLKQSFWTFYADKTPELTSLTKYLSK